MKHFKKIAIPVLLGTCLTASAASVAYANTEKKVGGYTSENVIAQIDDSAVTITDLEGNEAFLAAGPHGGAGAKSVFTDGVVSSTQTAMLVDSDGNGVIGYVTVDAGSVYTVNKVFVDIVHDWGATDFRIELSETADFADYNVVYSNVDGYSYSADSDVAISTVLGNVPNVGLTFEFSPVKARYIRVTGNTFGNGSNQNYTCLGEIGMYGITEGYVVSANRIGGKVSAEEGVVLSATDGAEIYYTVDGSVPTVDSAKYSEPIVAEKSLKLRAVAYKDGVYGTPFDYEYTFAAVKPEFVPVNIAKGKTVTVYKTDGSEIGVKNHNGSDTADAAVDGIKGTGNSFQLEGVGWVQVDFGASAWINRVDLTLWHDWVFRSITVQLSDDPTFASGVYTIVCTDNKGWQVSSSFCGSLDPNCPIDVNGEWIPHSGDGWTFNFAPVKGRYLRTLNQAGQGEYTTVLTEIQAYTCEDPSVIKYNYEHYVSSVSLPDDKEVFVNRDFADIGLSDTVVITYSDGTSRQVKVDYDSSSYDKTTAGTYEFALGVSDELDFYGLLSGASVKVVVKAIDYSAIDLAISKAEAAEQTAYTVTSYGAMTEALSAAKTVKSEEYKTQAQVDAAEKALSDKVADLKARGDVTELKALLEEVKTLKSTDYTQSTFAALQEEIASSEEVVAEGGNADLDQAQVDARFAALNAAKNALVAFADTSALEAYYEQCVETYGNEEGDTHGYYITGYVYYLDRMEDAEKVFAKKQSGELAQSEADECLVALKEAVAALERCADMTELKAAVKAAEDADASAYTSSSYAAMKQVYDEVVAISNKDASYMMQEEADEATEKMNGGLALLVSLGDKTELNQAIAQYSGESEEEYISAGFGAYSEAVYNAMAVKSSDDVSQEDVDAAVSALKAAYEALVRKGDKSVLTDLIAAAKEKLASETNETRKENLEKAIAFAEELVNFDGEVTAEQVEQSKEVLESAMKEGKKKGGCSGSVSAAGLAALAVLALAACVVIYRRKINE